MGYADRALRKAERGLAVAQKAAHPNSLAAALNHLAIAHMLRYENEIAIARAQEAIALANKEGLPLWAAVGMGTIGAVLVRSNQDAKAIVQLQHASEVVAASGSLLSPLCVGSLAQAFGKTGRVPEGLNLATMLLAAVHASATFVDEPWLYHVKGELFLNQDPLDIKEAESCFRTAIELARRIGARSTELRATTSLARLLANQGHRDEARALLAEIYGWFTEGFDTADLKDAKLVLEELAR
jgi:tetratricopeptide (TPR) repeat protein